MTRRVVVDCGHGGQTWDGRSSPSGVIGSRGLAEKDVTLALGRLIQRELRHEVELTRTTDHNLSLGARSEVARRAGADVFLSLHANHGPVGARGSEVYVHTETGARSRDLAQHLARRLGAGEPGSGRFAVLDPRRLPEHTAACLIEVDYLSDPDGERRLGNVEQLSSFARAIAAAVDAHVTARGLDDDIVDPWGRPPQPPCPSPGYMPRAAESADPWDALDSPEAWGGGDYPWPFGEFVAIEILQSGDLGRLDTTRDWLVGNHGDAFRAAIQKPAKRLTAAEAQLILVFLHFAAMIDLRTPLGTITPEQLSIAMVGGRVTLGPWMRITREGRLPTDPVSFAPGRVLFTFRCHDGQLGESPVDQCERPTPMPHLWDAARMFRMGSPISSVDPRFAVALFRFAAFLGNWWSTRAIYHTGINDPASAGHRDGTAIDFSGVLWNDGANDREILVLRDWGRQPIPQLRDAPTRWPETQTTTNFRLATRLSDSECHARFFASVFRFLRNQLTDTGPRFLPSDPAEVIASEGQTIYPDYPAPGLRKDHQNHIHAVLR